MGKIRRLFVFFSVLLLFIPVSFQGQEMMLSIETDTLTNSITNTISFIRLPEGGRVRYQQRLHPQTKLIRPPAEFSLWDTLNHIFTLIIPTYPSVDTLTVTFLCQMDTLPDVLHWGEAALMFENPNRIIEKINIAEKYHIVRSNNIPVDSLIKGFYYIQIMAAKTIQSKSNMASLVRLKNEHFIVEQKTETYYKYFIGSFSSEKQASEPLKYYRKYIPDAFIVMF